MRAFIRSSAESDDVSLAEMPVPVVGKDEALVQVHAFGVGIHDRYVIPADAQFPYVIGTEAAGVIVAVGDAVERFGVGDRVLLSSVLNPKGGSWAELAVVGEDGLTAMPESLDFETGAGFPIPGKTAIESLHTLDLSAGETLFVAGASGAIGNLVIQMAAARGIRVCGSASPPNHDYMLGLGAEQAVDYNASSWHQQVREWAPGGVDAVLAIQPGTGIASEPVLRDGGHLVTVSGDPFEPQRDIRVEQFVHRANAGEETAALLAAISEGRIRLVLEQVYRFEDAVAALEKTETRHARGKLVVTVRSDDAD